MVRSECFRIPILTNIIVVLQSWNRCVDLTEVHMLSKGKEGVGVKFMWYYYCLISTRLRYGCRLGM